MALADRPLAYCGNVHPTESLSDLRSQLERHALPAAKEIGRPISVGLWLPRSALQGLDDHAIAEFRSWFQGNGLSTTTMNAFPFGDFHASKVKERVYQPDWTEPERADYTVLVAEFLAKLLSENGEGSISTLPLAYRRLKPNAKAEDFFPNLLDVVGRLAVVKETTGRTIRLAIEPEPGCFLERTSDVIAFLSTLRSSVEPQSAEVARQIKEHLGVCFDVCHSAVMFENPGSALRSIAEAGHRVVKIQISSALELRTPADRGARKFLSQFVEERYLHQTTGVAGDRFLFLEDLTAPHALVPPEDWRSCASWRVHFHVPIHQSEIGPLHTTTWAVDETLAAAATLAETPDLEVETYTWDVLPAISRSGVPDLAQNLAAELRHAQSILDRLRA